MATPSIWQLFWCDGKLPFDDYYLYRLKNVAHISAKRNIILLHALTFKKDCYHQLSIKSYGFFYKGGFSNQLINYTHISK